MDFLEQALQYAEKGFSVFALPVKAKVPRKGTEGLKDATRNQEQIREWWSENAHYNIGIRCGNFKGKCLAVIDVDQHGYDGYESLRQLEDLYGPLPDTVTALTPTGGMHLYYLSPLALKSSAPLNKAYPGVDVRAEGAYTVAPPSIHPDTWTEYEWKEGHSPFDMPFALLPSAWEKAMERTKPKEEKATIEDKIFQQGERVSGLVSLIGSLVRKGLNDAEIRAAVDTANDLRCKPPLTPSEMETNVYPALTRNWLKEEPFWENITVNSSPLPEPETFADMEEQHLELAPELINGVLRQGHKLMLSAPSKAGKSFALIELAFAIAEGREWFGNPCRQGRVLYLNMEIDKASFVNRINKIYGKLSPARKTHKDNIVIWNLRGYAAPLDKLCDSIIEQGKGFSAIIIDPLYKVMMGSENDNSEMARMVSQFDRIASETGASVVVCHHFAKGFGGDKSVIDRGAGAGVFARDPDAILMMTPLEDKENGFRIEYVLREFPNHKPTDVEFVFPIHEVHYDWENIELEDSVSAQAKRKKKAEKKKTDIRETVAETAERIRDENGHFYLNDLANELEKFNITPSPHTIRSYLESFGYTVVKRGGKGFPDVWGKG